MSAASALAPEPATATGRETARAIEPASGSASDLLARFFAAQRARCEAYERWNAAGASAMRGDVSGDAFASATTSATAVMRDLSEEVRAGRANARTRTRTRTTRRETDRTVRTQIIACERGLRCVGREDAAILVRLVQMGEKTRLEMTCALHALRHARARGEWSWQRESGEDGVASVRRADETVEDGGSDALRPSWARSSGDPAACAPGCACANAPEPTREEYDNAVAEATQELERSAQEINDAIEELRYILEEET